MIFNLLFIPAVMLLGIYLCNFVAFFQKLSYFVFLASAIRTKN